MGIGLYLELDAEVEQDIFAPEETRVDRLDA
jgi:hypothetical protein